MPTIEDAQPIPPNETALQRETRIVQENGDGILILKAALQTLLKTADAGDSLTIFAFLIREIFGPVPDEIWQQLFHEAQLPCPQPGCECHIHLARLAEVIDTQREMFRDAHARIRAARQTQSDQQAQQEPQQRTPQPPE